MSDISSLGPNTTKIIQSIIPNENDIPQDQKPAFYANAANTLKGVVADAPALKENDAQNFWYLSAIWNQKASAIWAI